MKRLKKSYEYMHKITRFGELLLSIVILLAIILSGISLILELRQFASFQLDISAFTSFLASGLSTGRGNRVRENAVPIYAGSPGGNRYARHRAADGRGASAA